MTFEKALEAMKQGKKCECECTVHPVEWFKQIETEMICEIICIKKLEETCEFIKNLYFYEDFTPNRSLTPDERKKIENFYEELHDFTFFRGLSYRLRLDSFKAKRDEAETEKKSNCKCLDKLEEVYKFISYLYTECEFTPDICVKVTNCYEDLKDFLYYQRKNRG